MSRNVEWSWFKRTGSKYEMRMREVSGVVEYQHRKIGNKRWLKGRDPSERL